MLAYALPRRRDPWDCSQDKLPPVDLNALLLEIEVSGRPIHQQATIRKAMGLQVTNPGLEQALKEHGFWMKQAGPLHFDIADLVYMQPRAERAAIYGYLMGLPAREIAKQLGLSSAMVSKHRSTLQERFARLAHFFGVMGNTDPDCQIHATDVLYSLGINGNFSAYSLADAEGLPWPRLTRKAFVDIWPRLLRADDLPIHYDIRLGVAVSMDTIRQLNAGHITR